MSSFTKPELLLYFEPASDDGLSNKTVLLRRTVVLFPELLFADVTRQVLGLKMRVDEKCHKVCAKTSFDIRLRKFAGKRFC